MGKIFTKVKNPFRNFNFESRVQKAISQPKPVPAPKHGKEQIDMDRLLREYPEVYEESLKKNEQLNQHLKNVFVTSKELDSQPEPDPTKPLPISRKQVEEFEYGVKEPDKVPAGKVTLRTALEFLTSYQGNPAEFNAKNIAEKYTLPEEKVRDIVKYFRVFEVYVPQEKQPKATFAGPSLPRSEIRRHSPKQLESSTSKMEKS